MNKLEIIETYFFNKSLNTRINRYYITSDLGIVRIFDSTKVNKSTSYPHKCAKCSRNYDSIDYYTFHLLIHSDLVLRIKSPCCIKQLVICIYNIDFRVLILNLCI